MRRTGYGYGVVATLTKAELGFAPATVAAGQGLSIGTTLERGQNAQLDQTRAIDARIADRDVVITTHGESHSSYSSNTPE